MFNFKSFTEANIARCECPAPHGFGHKLNSWSVLEWAGAMGGEIGEAQNIAKKMLRFRDNVAGNAPGKSRDAYKKEFARECADGFIYMVLVCASEGIDLEQEIYNAFNEKSKQIGSGIFVGPVPERGETVAGTVTLL